MSTTFINYYNEVSVPSISSLPLGLNYANIQLENGKRRHFVMNNIGIFDRDGYKGGNTNQEEEDVTIEIVYILHPSSRIPFSNEDPYAPAARYEARTRWSMMASLTQAIQNLDGNNKSHHVVLVYLASREIRGTGSGIWCWGAGNDNNLCSAEIDGSDMEFMDALMEDYFKFPTQNYIFGYSGGARMAWRIACGSKQNFKGMAAASGFLPSFLMEDNNNKVLVSNNNNNTAMFGIKEYDRYWNSASISSEEICRISNLPPTLIVLHGDLDETTSVQNADRSVDYIVDEANCNSISMNNENDGAIPDEYIYTDCEENDDLQLTYYRRRNGLHMTPGTEQLKRVFMKFFFDSEEEEDITENQAPPLFGTSTTLMPTTTTTTSSSTLSSLSLSDSPSYYVASSMPSRLREVSFIRTSNPTTNSLTPSSSLLISNMPTILLSNVPSTSPSLYSSTMPSFLPSQSNAPSSSPSDMPSLLPSLMPTLLPSSVHSDMPSSSTAPSSQISEIPSSQPSEIPSLLPSIIPSPQPSETPSPQPSDIPSIQPSKTPSSLLSEIPSSLPSETLSSQPTKAPSLLPSEAPLSPLPSDIPTSLPFFIASDMPSSPSRAPLISLVASNSPSVILSSSTIPTTIDEESSAESNNSSDSTSAPIFSSSSSLFPSTTSQTEVPTTDFEFPIDDTLRHVCSEENQEGVINFLQDYENTTFYTVDLFQNSMEAINNYYNNNNNSTVRRRTQQEAVTHYTNFLLHDVAVNVEIDDNENEENINDNIPQVGPKLVYHLLSTVVAESWEELVVIEYPNAKVFQQSVLQNPSLPPRPPLPPSIPLVIFDSDGTTRTASYEKDDNHFYHRSWMTSLVSSTQIPSQLLSNDTNIYDGGFVLFQGIKFIEENENNSTITGREYVSQFDDITSSLKEENGVSTSAFFDMETSCYGSPSTELDQIRLESIPSLKSYGELLSSPTWISASRDIRSKGVDTTHSLSAWTTPLLATNLYHGMRRNNNSNLRKRKKKRN